MVEVLNNSVVWWHWIALGLLLIFTEMATGTFISLGLGIAALIVGIMDFIFPMGLTYQLIAWIIFSILCISLLFKKFKREPTVSQSGQSDFHLDTLGSVIETILPHQKGRVIFDRPVLGNTHWQAFSDEMLPEGTRIKIVEINGQLMKVTHLKSQKG